MKRSIKVLAPVPAILIFCAAIVGKHFSRESFMADVHDPSPIHLSDSALPQVINEVRQDALVRFKAMGINDTNLSIRVYKSQEEVIQSIVMESSHRGGFVVQ